MYETFQETCIHRKLVENDSYWYIVMEEMILTKMPFSLRHIFAHLCLNCQPENPLNLYHTYKTNMMEDYLKSYNYNDSEQYLLIELQRILNLNDSSLQQFKLPVPIISIESERIIDEFDEIIIKKANDLFNTLNSEQLICYREIIETIQSPEKLINYFILDGPGGSGKTYLWTTLYYILQGLYSN